MNCINPIFFSPKKKSQMTKSKRTGPWCLMWWSTGSKLHEWMLSFLFIRWRCCSLAGNHSAVQCSGEQGWGKYFTWYLYLVLKYPDPSTCTCTCTWTLSMGSSWYLYLYLVRKYLKKSSTFQLLFNYSWFLYWKASIRSIACYTTVVLGLWHNAQANV